MEESSLLQAWAAGLGEGRVLVIPSCTGQTVGPGGEDRLGHGSRLSNLTAWLRTLTERGGHTRSARESSSEACLKGLVLPALGYTLGLIAKWYLLILEDCGHLLSLWFLPRERISLSIARGLQRQYLRREPQPQAGQLAHQGHSQADPSSWGSTSEIMERLFTLLSTWASSSMNQLPSDKRTVEQASIVLFWA